MHLIKRILTWLPATSEGRTTVAAYTLALTFELLGLYSLKFALLLVVLVFGLWLIADLFLRDKKWAVVVIGSKSPTILQIFCALLGLALAAALVGVRSL